jgi:ribosomal-protein-alanine N-acetyltransferase
MACVSALTSAAAAGRLQRLAQPTLCVDDLVVRPWRFVDAPAVVATYRDPAIRFWHGRSMTAPEAVLG